jgi:excisionase family DNA binding protein
MGVISNSMLTTKEAAEFLGIRPSTLNVWRSSGTVNVPYIRVGTAIRYRLSDLEEYVSKRRVMPTEME